MTQHCYKIFGVLLIITKKGWNRIMLAQRMRGKLIGILLVTNRYKRKKILFNFAFLHTSANAVINQ